MKGFSLIKFWPRGAIITTVPVPVNPDFRHRFFREIIFRADVKLRLASQPGDRGSWGGRWGGKLGCMSNLRWVISNVLEDYCYYSRVQHNSFCITSSYVSIYVSFTTISTTFASNNQDFWYFVCYFAEIMLESMNQNHKNKIIFYCLNVLLFLKVTLYHMHNISML